MKVRINPYKNAYKSPAHYYKGVCFLNKCLNNEWDLMIALDLEIEYMTQVLTHENIHLLECKFQRSSTKPDKLLHISDICALVGF